MKSLVWGDPALEATDFRRLSQVTSPQASPRSQESGAPSLLAPLLGLEVRTQLRNDGALTAVADGDLRVRQP